MRKVNLAILLFTLMVIGACKKEDNTPSVQVLLTQDVWIGEKADYEAPGNTGSIPLDTTALSFTDNGEVILYSRNSTNNSLTERARNPYTLSADNKKIILGETVKSLIPADVAELAEASGIQIPTEATIQTITESRLVLFVPIQGSVFGFPVNGEVIISFNR